MAGISDKALKSNYAENKYRYNGIEYDSTFGLDEYEAHFRDLDPQTGRWWQIDPEADKERVSLSPYGSMSNDPVFKTDPLGNEDEACCGGIIDKVKSFTRDVMIFSAAAANAWGSNQVGGAGRADPSTMDGLTDHDRQVAQLGQTTGDAASVVTGGIEIGGSGAGELASLGTLTPVALAVGAHGLSSIVTGFSNLVKDFQKVNSNNSDADNGAGSRRKNRLPDKGEPNSTQSNDPGTTTKKYGPDGNVQKEYNEGHQGANVPKNEQSDHVHDYKPNPNNPSGRGDRQPGRPPKRNEAQKDFNRKKQ